MPKFMFSFDDPIVHYYYFTGVTVTYCFQRQVKSTTDAPCTFSREHYYNAAIMNHSSHSNTAGGRKKIQLGPVM